MILGLDFLGLVLSRPQVLLPEGDGNELGAAALSYVALAFSFGFAMSWTLAGTNAPIYAEIVPPAQRTLVYGMDAALEGSAGAFGAPIAGWMALHVFHYNTAAAGPGSGSGGDGCDPANAHSLGRAVVWTMMVPLAPGGGAICAPPRIFTSRFSVGNMKGRVRVASPPTATGAVDHLLRDLRPAAADLQARPAAQRGRRQQAGAAAVRAPNHINACPHDKTTQRRQRETCSASIVIKARSPPMREKSAKSAPKNTEISAADKPVREPARYAGNRWRRAVPETGMGARVCPDRFAALVHRTAFTFACGLARGYIIYIHTSEAFDSGDRRPRRNPPSNPSSASC